MHDTLRYFSREPVHRRFHQDEITFAQLYEHSERFIMPLSHDEVVHGKRSLLEKMPGDAWQKFANLRAAARLSVDAAGQEAALHGHASWRPPASGTSSRASTGTWRRIRRGRAWRGCSRSSAASTASTPACGACDPDPEGFAWIDCHDREHSVLSYLRRDGGDELLVVLNATPAPRTDYRIGAPPAGAWRLRLSTDAHEFGGSGFAASQRAAVEAVPFHGYAQSMRLALPPLAALVLERER